MWAGLASKVICDHLGLGCKTGLPYVWNADKPSGAKSAGSIQKDSKALAWQVKTALGKAESWTVELTMDIASVYQF